MKTMSLIFAAGLFALPFAARAQSPVVAELFTSQGCSSCPPADAVLGDLAGRDDVLALSLHVDYWDYLGWKDRFASPKFTQRQRKYAHAFGNRSIYTPQLVVQGVDETVGSRRRDVDGLIAKHARSDSTVSVNARRSGDEIKVALKAGSGPAGRCVVQLVEYSPSLRMSIDRGENAGRTITYHNVVRRWITLGDWDGRGAAEFSGKSTSGLPVAIIVQGRNFGPILAAAVVK